MGLAERKGCRGEFRSLRVWDGAKKVSRVDWERSLVGVGVESGIGGVEGLGRR